MTTPQAVLGARTFLSDAIMSAPADVRREIYRAAFEGVPSTLPLARPLKEWTWTHMFQLSPAVYQDCRRFFYQRVDIEAETTDLTLDLTPGLRTSVPECLRFQFVDGVESVVISGEALPAFANDYLAGPDVADRRPFNLCPTGPYLTSLRKVTATSAITVDDFAGPASLYDPVTSLLPDPLSRQNIFDLVEAAVPDAWELLVWLERADDRLDAALALLIDYDHDLERVCTVVVRRTRRARDAGYVGEIHALADLNGSRADWEAALLTHLKLPHRRDLQGASAPG